MPIASIGIRNANQLQKIHFGGIVQGVGFRPFVYKLAQELGLRGYVFNSSAGVTVDVEGADPELECFIRRLRMRLRRRRKSSTLQSESWGRPAI